MKKNMKKKMIVLLAGALLAIGASNAMASFEDYELIRVVYNTSTGNEMATDLGGHTVDTACFIKSVIPVGATNPHPGCAPAAVAVDLLPAGAPDGVLDGLRRLGHRVEHLADDGALGHEHAIELVDGGPAAGGSLAAATDPRSAGVPAVR